MILNVEHGLIRSWRLGPNATTFSLVMPLIRKKVSSAAKLWRHGMINKRLSVSLESKWLIQRLLSFDEDCNIQMLLIQVSTSGIFGDSFYFYESNP